MGFPAGANVYVFEDAFLGYIYDWFGLERWLAALELGINRYRVRCRLALRMPLIEDLGDMIQKVSST